MSLVYLNMATIDLAISRKASPALISITSEDHLLFETMEIFADLP
jgi:hypothetical protein